MTNDLIPGSAEGNANGHDPCGRNGAAYAPGNTAFCRHYMSRLLHRIGVALPRLLDGQDLIRESRAIEQRCWRELGYEKQPIYDGDLPAFLMVDGDGYPVALSSPADPEELASLLAAVEPSPPPAESCIGTNLDTLAQLLNFTPFEFQWLLWSYCIRSFGRAILPAIPLRDATHACDVLAMLCEMPWHRADCTHGVCWMALVAMVRCRCSSAAGCLLPINLQMGLSSPMPRTLIC